MAAITVRCRRADIVGDHGGDPATAVGLAEQMLSHGCRDNRMDVLMLGECLYLRLVQSALSTRS